MQVTYFISESNELVCMILECSFFILLIYRVLKHKKTVSSIVLISILMTLVYNLEGSHQEVIH